MTVKTSLTKRVSRTVANTVHVVQRMDRSLITENMKNYASTSTGIQTIDRNVLLKRRITKLHIRVACFHMIVHLSRVLSNISKLYGHVMEIERAINAK